jgi:hypothetical protein
VFWCCQDSSGCCDALRVQLRDDDINVVTGCCRKGPLKAVSSTEFWKTTTCNATWFSQERSSAHGVSGTTCESPRDSVAPHMRLLLGMTRQTVSSWWSAATRVRPHSALPALPALSGETQNTTHDLDVGRESGCRQCRGVSAAATRPTVVMGASHRLVLHGPGGVRVVEHDHGSWD